MFSLRTHLIICLSLFGALIGFAVLGNVLAAVGVIKPLHGAAQTVGVGVLLILFVAAGLSAIPVMVKVVLGAQERLGNQNPPIIGAMVARQTAIVWVMWILILAGLVVALPAMVADGFFGAGPKLWVQRTIGRMAAGPTLGRLAARPDMAVADMTRQSTLPIDVSHADAAIAGGGVFDFAIPGTTIEFPGARYYFITTYEHDHSRVQALNIGTSPQKMTRGELDAANAALRARLIGDGWLAGHEIYRGEEDVSLHGGAARGPKGRSWLKDGMVLDIESKRMDDEKLGENPRTAGEWIQFIELWPSKDYPGIDRLVFAPPTAPTTSAP
jgi:hypothetical protein